MKVTITEALAELKTIDKRIAKKREFVEAYLMRQEMLKDPHEKDGGSVSAIRTTLQAIRDLEERVVRIRRAINEANLATVIHIADRNKTVADWIIWRREVAPHEQQFLTQLANKIATTRASALQKGMQMVGASSPENKPFDVIVNINEKDLAKWREDLETVLETLDGQLSLKNATVTIEVE